MLAARAAGAGEVWISARHPHQAELARALGASRVLEEAEATPESLALLGMEAPIDLVVETVGGSADTLPPHRSQCGTAAPSRSSGSSSATSPSPRCRSC